jgi:hypothetical protein
VPAARAFLDNPVQLVEACVPELAVPLDPRRLFLQLKRKEKIDGRKKRD